MNWQTPCGFLNKLVFYILKLQGWNYVLVLFVGSYAAYFRNVDGAKI